jgi:hypothetical protein
MPADHFHPGQPKRYIFQVPAVFWIRIRIQILSSDLRIRGSGSGTVRIIQILTIYDYLIDFFNCHKNVQVGSGS